jgi:hypothetical protein
MLCPLVVRKNPLMCEAFNMLLFYCELLLAPAQNWSWMISLCLLSLEEGCLLACSFRFLHSRHAVATSDRVNSPINCYDEWMKDTGIAWLRSCQLEIFMKVTVVVFVALQYPILRPNAVRSNSECRSVSLGWVFCFGAFELKTHSSQSEIQTVHYILVSADCQYLYVACQ